MEYQEDYLKRLQACGMQASDYSFVNLWGWAKEYGLEWAWTDAIVWIRQTMPKSLYWAPICQWDAINWQHLLSSKPYHFVRIPEQLLSIWKNQLGNQIVSKSERGQWDYLYSINELATLKGNRFHKKKNLVNQFKKNYHYTYVNLGKQYIDEVIAMQEDWCNWRDCESFYTLASENRSISRVLKYWDKLKNITGGVLLVDHLIVAYTVAELFNQQSVIIHFEKGCPSYKGIYQAINQLFIQTLTNDYQIVNREQDVNDDGLRKAKLSYHPVSYVKKYQVKFNQS